MSSNIEHLQEFLLAGDQNRPQLLRGLQEAAKELHGEEQMCIRSAVRLATAVQLFDGDSTRVGTSDVAVLLRQTIRAYGRRLTIKSALWQVLSSREQSTGLRADESDADGNVCIAAPDWQPDWLDSAAEIDRLEQRRSEIPAIGDGLLYAMEALRQSTQSIISTYLSEAQKAAVSSCLFERPGSTLLVTLPTGAGKSMCVTLPAWSDSYGGRVRR